MTSEARSPLPSLMHAESDLNHTAVRQFRISTDNLGLAPERAARDRERSKLPAHHGSSDSSPDDAFEEAGMHAGAQAGGAEGMVSGRDCQSIV